MSGRVTIKSIARDLGISHMTVSRALSGHPSVQKETREAVLKRARELGYVRSAAARAMRGDGTGIVGLLLPNITNEFYARFANTLGVACEASRFHLIIHLTDDQPEIEQQALERLREVQAMAVVMVPTPGPGTGAGHGTLGMKIVQFIRRRPLEEPSAAVLVDDRAAIRDAVAHLAGAGHTAIAYVGATLEVSSGRERLSAFRAGLEAVSLREDPALVHTLAPSFAMGRGCTTTLLEQGQVSAVVCGGVELSTGALAALMEKGVQPGRDIALIGYGDPSFYAWIGGGVSTIRVPIDELARQTAALLGAKSNAAPLTCPEIRTARASLVIRGSTAHG